MILLCGTGMGIYIAAKKRPNVHATGEHKYKALERKMSKGLMCPTTSKLNS